MDAYVQVLSGEMNITIDQTTQTVKSGEMILMPAGINHALEALEPSKMLLTMVGL
jgi:quercetin dioxygenase-like cupin family protein